MPSRDFQLHFCQSLAGLSNEGSVDQGDSSHSHQLVPIQNWTGSLVCGGLHPFRAICMKTHRIKNDITNTLLRPSLTNSITNSLLVLYVEKYYLQSRGNTGSLFISQFYSFHTLFTTRILSALTPVLIHIIL